MVMLNMMKILTNNKMFVMTMRQFSYSYSYSYSSKSNSRLLLRSFHTTQRSLRSQRQQGAGGSREEAHIGQAIRNIKEKLQGPLQFDRCGVGIAVVLEIMNARHVDIANEYISLKRQRYYNEKQQQVWIRVLTHADCLSRTALEYQMQRAASASSSNAPAAIPVVAINLQDVATKESKSKPTLKQFKSLVNVILGTIEVVATHHQQPTPNASAKVLVTGLPNAGKSSLIYPLTHNRTQQVKKKKGDYHMPKISSKAGWTLSVKSHVVETARGDMISLLDTPGLRPAVQHLKSSTDLAYLLATQSMSATKGMIQKEQPQQDATDDSDDEEYDGTVTPTEIVHILWQGLQRHAEVVETTRTTTTTTTPRDPPKEFDATATTTNFSSPEELWEHYVHRHLRNDKSNKDGQVLQHLIRYCNEGGYGGMIIEKRRPQLVVSTKDTTSSSLRFCNPDTPVVAMNEAAVWLRDVGEGRQSASDDLVQQFFVPPPCRRRGDGRNQRDNNSTTEKNHPQHSRRHNQS